MSQGRVDALTSDERAKYWPISPNVAIEVKSDTDDFSDVVTRIETFIELGSEYTVAIDPETREVQERGTPPRDLLLAFDAVIDA